MKALLFMGPLDKPLGHMSFEILAIITSAYLTGSFPTGLVLTKLFGRTDIRKSGSGNIGATNVYRVMGKKIGALTLLLDVLKGGVFVILARDVTSSEIWTCAAGLAAFVGHIYPIYLGFRGGKGVATYIGVFLVLAPKALLSDLGVFLLVVYQSRYVSLASLAAAAIMPVLLLVLSYSQMTILLAVVMGVLIFVRHRDNIQRLKQGVENRIGIR